MDNADFKVTEPKAEVIRNLPDDKKITGLVVLALERIGIADVAALKAGRRYVYFVLVIIAAVITPGDVITATVALLVPLILLYELGIWLSQLGRKKDAAMTA